MAATLPVADPVAGGEAAPSVKACHSSRSRFALLSSPAAPAPDPFLNPLRAVARDGLEDLQRCPYA